MAILALRAAALAAAPDDTTAAPPSTTSSCRSHDQQQRLVHRPVDIALVADAGSGSPIAKFQYRLDAGAPVDTDTAAPETEPADDKPEVKLRKNETIEPVEGHAYAEITSGARAGMYINTSGNKRHGEAFVLVQKKLGVEYHIYGSGADRQVVALEPRDEKDEE